MRAKRLQQSWTVSTYSLTLDLSHIVDVQICNCSRESSVPVPLNLGAVSVQTSWSLSLLIHQRTLMKHHYTKHAGKAIRQSAAQNEGQTLSCSCCLCCLALLSKHAEAYSIKLHPALRRVHFLNI